jgi:hypothetical protein
MSTRLSEREERQLELMRERLVLYKNGELPLPRLIADLDALIEALEEVDPAWRRTLRGRWSVLEEVYAVALDRRLTRLDEEGQQLVRKAVDDILQLVTTKPADVETD